MDAIINGDERREALWVHPQYQKSFVASFCLAAFGGIASTIGLLAYLFHMASSRADDLVFWPLILVNIVVLLALVAIAGVVALNLSHKVGGPLYRIEKRFREIGRGGLAGQVSLRHGDKLHGMAEAVNQMSRELNQRMNEIGDRLESLAGLTGQPQRAHELKNGLRVVADELKRGSWVK